MVRKIYVETMQDMTVCRTGWRLFLQTETTAVRSGPFCMKIRERPAPL